MSEWADGMKTAAAYGRAERADVLLKVAEAAHRSSDINLAEADEARGKGDLNGWILHLAAAQASTSLARELTDSVTMETGHMPRRKDDA